MKLGAVPMRLIVPPSTAAKESGIRMREGARSERRANTMPTGSRMATTAVLFMNAARRDVALIKRITIPNSLRPPIRWRPRAIKVATPLSRRAMPMTKMAPMAITALLPKPTRASRKFGRTPVALRMTGMLSAVTGSGIQRVMNSVVAAARVARAIQPWRESSIAGLYNVDLREWPGISARKDARICVRFGCAD